MAKKDNSAIVEFFVYDSEGDVDKDATIQNYRQALNNHIEARKETFKQAATAVHAVLDKNPDANFNLKALISFALREIKCTPDNYEDSVKAVDTYIHNCPSLKIVKGPGGGVKRV